ncbi:endonuclease/exonuclease/phosphatase family protein [Bacillus tianshenii]|uniref:endonuclease/exonuclease/phosphatase family protein n=1 Tax=Sutcliffiella tianshenii TaxID=1463404 RepID=UPI001CD56CB1|nr:endonuclease/exonuclease/phosphatase family protein [Bacillus tianshenii]MCA1319655.1 endonuclease/exonuclease/phosphatase family protein [Bacillus tianshenii]
MSSNPLAAFLGKKNLVGRTILAIACMTFVTMAGFTNPAMASNTSIHKEHENMVDLKIMTYNIWLGGKVVSFDRTVEAIEAAGADIVGIQEGGSSIPELAERLGFHYDEGRQIISRYPIIESGHPDFVYIEVKPSEVVAVSNTHLTPYPYGPYDIKDGVSVEDVLKNERTYHMKEVESKFKELPKLAKDGIPVFLTGDFNVASHLDWIEATKETHFGVTVTWPVSKKLEQLKFRDTYREINPDPVTHPAFTWTPVLYEGWDEVHDRIDFIYAAGPSVTLDSQIVGEDGPYSDIKVTPWPSDHRAVVSTFRTELADLPKIKDSKISLTSDKLEYGQDEQISLQFSHLFGPNNWVGIYPTGTNVNSDTPSLDWQYTGKHKKGTLTFQSGKLAPGAYDAVLIYGAQGRQVLAKTTFTILKP